jgi:hypothetical protein
MVSRRYDGGCDASALCSAAVGDSSLAKSRMVARTPAFPARLSTGDADPSRAWVPAKRARNAAAASGHQVHRLDGFCKRTPYGSSGSIIIVIVIIVMISSSSLWRQGPRGRAGSEKGQVG